MFPLIDISEHKDLNVNICSIQKSSRYNPNTENIYRQNLKCPPSTHFSLTDLLEIHIS